MPASGEGGRGDDHVHLPPAITALNLPHAVGEALRPFLGRPGLLTPEQEAGDPRRYRTHLLHVPDDGAYSLVAAVWRPGQRTPVHDHIAWCVVGVHHGEEHEIRYRLVGGHLVEDGHTVGPCGEVTVLTQPGDIHAVVNDGGPTVSGVTSAPLLCSYPARLRQPNAHREGLLRHHQRLDLRPAGVGVDAVVDAPGPVNGRVVAAHCRGWVPP